MSVEDAKARRPLPALTGLRFIAASAVFLFHFAAVFFERVHAPRQMIQLARNGYLGVSLFFMLSGFILTYTYSGKLAYRRHALLAYWVARLARIYPVYLLALMLMLPLAADTLSVGNTLEVLTMTQSWTVPASDNGFAWIMQAWTLSVELVFYAAFLPLLPLVQRLGLRVSVALAALCALAITASLAPTCTPGEHFTGLVAMLPIPVTRLSEFIYGMLLARVMLLVGDRFRQGWTMAAIVVVVGCVVWLLGNYNDANTVSFAMVLVGVVIALLAGPSGPIERGLGSRVMLLLGGASYALYLLQQPIRGWLRVFPGEPMDKPLNPLVAIAAAILVFLFYEQPVRIWLRRLFQPLRAGSIVPRAT